MTVVTTWTGAVRGTRVEGVERFLGIPYARASRFGAPQPAEPWTGTRDADAYGPMCPQLRGEQYLLGGVGESEARCLSLNVWTPGLSGRRPVMVWVHGGGFRQGASSSLLYDGAPLARRGDVVVVTINYRLGALGFAAHPDLATDGGPCGNWGLADQVAALRWVHEHAAAFGGDAANVTIFGESAGAASVGLLTVMPSARDLFGRAVAQSGASRTISLERAARRTEELAAELGVTHVAGLRDVPVDALLAAQQALEARRRGVMVFTPAVDGAVVDRPPLEARRAGAGGGIPMIVGTNVDEWKLWAPTDPHARDLDDARLRRRLGKVLHDGVDEVIEVFRRERTGRGEAIAPNDLWFAIESDRFFRAPVLRDADAHVAHEPATFVYRFAWGSPAMRGWLGACHALEIGFVFGTQGRPGLAGFTGSGPEADALSDRMVDAWAAFARTGSPSTGALAWPPHDPASRPTMVFDARCRLEHAPGDAERAVVAAHGVDPMG